jgi:hypothetical protein
MEVMAYLLSPHVDKLFDKGWISFSEGGDVLCANDELKTLMIRWGLNPERNVGPFKPKQRNYLAYHRGNIYKASSSCTATPANPVGIGARQSGPASPI